MDKNKPDELAKYTGFVIESISRIFSSPTEPVFEGRQAEINSTEKIIKAVGEVIEPLAKGLRR